MEDMVMAMIMATDIIAILIVMAPIITVMHILINIPNILMVKAVIITDQGTDPVMGDEIMG
jgi:hypothetical protein